MHSSSPLCAMRIALRVCMQMCRRSRLSAALMIIASSILPNLLMQELASPRSLPGDLANH